MSTSSWAAYWLLMSNSLAILNAKSPDTQMSHPRSVNLFTKKISQFMVKLLETPPSAEKKALLLSGL